MDFRWRGGSGNRKYFPAWVSLSIPCFYRKSSNSCSRIPSSRFRSWSLQPFLSTTDSALCTGCPFCEMTFSPSSLHTVMLYWDIFPAHTLRGRYSAIDVRFIGLGLRSQTVTRLLLFGILAWSKTRGARCIRTARVMGCIGGNGKDSRISSLVQPMLEGNWIEENEGNSGTSRVTSTPPSHPLSTLGSQRDALPAPSLSGQRLYTSRCPFKTRVFRDSNGFFFSSAHQLQNRQILHERSRRTWNEVLCLVGTIRP
ncbi:hypothetical protein EDD15DRAFT_895026 [Pisolithus albus]|nr:hypothetical protein EDD15DRAFT_895026 [Pisolithus albus]